MVEPRYPGAFETLIALGDCWDEDALEASRPQIMELSARISRCHEHSSRFLSAAGSILNDTYRIALEFTDAAKIERYASRFARRELGRKASGRGRQSFRFLSGVTNQGLLRFDGTIQALAQKIYLVEDPYGAASRLLLDQIRARALERGYDVIVCSCPLSPFDKAEHLIIPELSLAVMSGNCTGLPQVKACRTIHYTRFTDLEGLRTMRNRLGLNKKAALQLLGRSCELLAEAKALHDELERYYIAATDFEAVDLVTDALREKILKKYHPSVG